MNNNIDVWELLREAQGMLESYPQDSNEVCTLLHRIDAALAARAAEGRVEWHTHERSTICEGVICTIGYSPIADYEDPWWWRADNTKTGKWKFDRVATEDKAKAAVIAAAKGMK